MAGATTQNCNCFSVITRAISKLAPGKYLHNCFVDEKLVKLPPACNKTNVSPLG